MGTLKCVCSSISRDIWLNKGQTPPAKCYLCRISNSPNRHCIGFSIIQMKFWHQIVNKNPICYLRLLCTFSSQLYSVCSVAIITSKRRNFWRNLAYFRSKFQINYFRFFQLQRYWEKLRILDCKPYSLSLLKNLVEENT